MESPDLHRRFNVGVAAGVIVIAAALIFLAMPLTGTGAPDFLVAVQTQLRAALVSLAPYLVVGGLGGVVGLAELSKTFSDYPREAIAARWGQYLIWLNAVAAMFAYFVARIYTPPETNSVLLILAVGLGFPALIRTKFTYAKELDGEGSADSSVNIGWLYEQFQYLCKKQIDLELMSYRRMQVDRLMGRFLTVQELYQTAVYTLNARATLTPEEEAARLDELQKAIDPKLPADLARLNLGLLILELGGVSYVDLLTRAKSMEAAAAAGGEEVSVDAAVKELRALPLADLQALALGALTAPEDQARVKSLCEPVPGIPEVTQRASVARLLADRVGAKTAQELARQRPSPAR
jgi:hypothetical protein